MSHISRRTWLKGLGLFSVVAGNASMLVSTAAEAKASKAAIYYRDSPNGMQMWHMCKYYIASGGAAGWEACAWMAVP